jgi:uncharacterized protein
MITGFFAGLLALMYVYLSFRIIFLRAAQKINLGGGGFPPLEIAIRVHGNFSEYVPIALILIGILELNGAPSWAIYVLGGVFILGRMIHISAFLNPERLSLPRRVMGMVLTLSVLLIAAAWLIVDFMMF